MSNLGLKDAVVSSKLFKFGINLLELLLTLFIYGHLLVDKLLHKIFKVEFGLGRVEGLLFHRKSWWVLWFGVWIKWFVKMYLIMKILDGFSIGDYKS